jgi:general secretion pathway protein A
MAVKMINEFYGISGNPFHPTPNPRFLFLTNSHREALASMIYGIQERKGFVSLIGEVGTGKTTLIRHLLSSLDPKIKTVFISQTFLTFEELLKEILSQLGLSLGDRSKFFLIHQLNDYLIQRLLRKETLVLIVDAAQNLSKEALEDLRLLSNLETDRFKPLQIVLAGQPELEEKLNSEELRQFRQRIGIRRKILPLTGEESRQYIAHRLNKVGSSPQTLFTPEAVSLICWYARGIPRVINTLCERSFLIGYAKARKPIDEKIVNKVLQEMGNPARIRKGGSEGARKAYPS